MAQIQVHVCWCHPPQSTGRSRVHRDGTTPSFSTNSFISHTSPPILMVVNLGSQFTAPFILKWVYLSRLAIMSYMIGFQTWPPRHSPPCMFTTTPSSTQVVSCGREMTICIGLQETKIYLLAGKSWIKKGISLSMTSDREVRNVFTTCVLWIRIPFPNRTSLWINVSRQQKNRRSGSTCSPVYRSATTYPPLSSW